MQSVKDNFIKMMRGELSNEQMERILLETKITTKNVVDARAAILEVSEGNLPVITSKLRNQTIDVCGTGGDGLNTLNISTAVAFVLAGAGIKVAKHGNKGVSSLSGSSDVLQELGINVMSDNYLRALEDDECNICFLFAPKFYPAMKHVAPVRAKLGKRTIFNVLGPLLNPLGLSKQLIGVYSKELVDVLSPAFKDMLFIHSLDGMDEASIFADTYTSEGILKTKQNGFNIEQIKGQGPQYNANELLELLKGESDNEAYKQMVIVNAELAANIMNIKINAKQVINSGSAYKSFEKLQSYCS